MNKLPFLKELVEARLFTDAKTVDGKSIEHIAETVYLMIMMLEILRHTDHVYAVDYANKTLAYNTYDNMHYSGTDLGNLLAVLNNQDTFSKHVKPAAGISIPLFQINRYLNACKSKSFNHNDDATFFWRLEDYLKLYSKSNFRKLRRDVGDWARLTYTEKVQINALLRSEFDKRASTCDIYQWWKTNFRLVESVNRETEKIVFHTSCSINRKSIQEKGLLPQTVEHAHISRKPGVFVFATQLHANEWAFWDALHKKDTVDIWKITLPSSYKLYRDSYPDMQEFDAYFGLERIPADWMELVKVQPVPNLKTDNPPMSENVVAATLQYHSTLNPELWDGFSLKADVKLALANIANKFSEFLDVNQLKIVDYIITGSNCAYNYTEFSDIDIHVVVDSSKLGHNPLTAPFLAAKKALWNTGHDITVKGYDVELYAEDIADAGNKLVATGIFSLLKNEWVKKPQKVEVKYNDSAVESKVTDLIAQIDDLVDSHGSQDQVNDMWSKLYKMRRAGLAATGEFDCSNLAFKVLRNAGYIEKLKEYERTIIDQDLTLEHQTIREVLGTK